MTIPMGGHLMITWMTRKSIGATAQDLDITRLGNQRRETMQILDALTGVKSPVPPNHPVLKMWIGYEFGLAIYGMMMSMEWHMNRGYADGVFWEFKRVIEALRVDEPGIHYEPPPWFQDTDVLQSHRSNLMRRDAQYNKTWKGTPALWPYLWPFVDDSEEGYSLMLSKSDKLRLKNKTRTLPKSVMERIANA